MKSTTRRIARAVRRPVRLLANLLLVALVVGCTAYLVPGLFGYERYVITGGSMSGSIEKGSLVFSELTPVEDLEVGDVVTYVPPVDSGVTTLVTHRLTAIRTGQDGELVFRTQGDANPDPDPWRFSLPSAEQPVVTHVVPYVGHVIIALADPDVRRLVIGIPAAGIALMALRDLVRALRRPRTTQDADPGDTPHDTGVTGDPGPIRPRLVPSPRRAA